MNSPLNYESAADVLPRTRQAIVELLVLAAPTVVQMASYTIMQFVDTWMLSRVGVVEATAAGNSGLISFSVISLGMGVLWIVNTLVSQSFGRRDFSNCGKYLWQGIWFSALFSLLLLPLLPFARHLFLAFDHEPILATQEAIYFRITVGATIVKLAATALGQFLLAINRPVAVLVAAVCGMTFNFFANWALIFGHLGFEPMGVAGAAWGTNISVVIEMLVLGCLIMRPSIRGRFNVLDWRLRRAEMKTLLMIGIPSGLQLIADVLAWSLFSLWVMNQFGIPAMAANNFMMRYMVISFMPAFGIAAAVTALVGRYIGMGRPDIAIQQANLGFVLTAGYMLSCGMVFLFGRNVLLTLFTDDPEILRIGAMLLVFAAIYQFFDAMYIVYNGALRGAGDTFVPAVATGALCWGITVLGGYAVARAWPGLGPAGPWSVATGYGIILGLFMLYRFRRGGWKRIRLVDHASSKSAADSVTVVSN